MKDRNELRTKLQEVLEENIECALDSAYLSEEVDDEGGLECAEYNEIVVQALQNVLAIKRTLVRK